MKSRAMCIYCLRHCLVSRKLSASNKITNFHPGLKLKHADIYSGNAKVIEAYRKASLHSPRDTRKILITHFDYFKMVL
jgi:hypothetical protein